MKQFAEFQWDGFKGSIELLRFIDGVTDDLITTLSALVGTNTVFIKGGDISESGGNTTITDGIIFKDNKFYSFTGGTYAGTPATLNVLFTEATAVGFPQPYFSGDPVAKDIYLDRTANVDATGTVVLDTIGSIYNLQTAKPILDSVADKADKNGYTDITSTCTVAAGFSVYASAFQVREYHDGTISIYAYLTFSGAKSKGTTIITGLPTNGSLYDIKTVFLNDISSNTHVGFVNQTVGTLSVFEGFTSDIVNIILKIDYKKAS